MNQTELYKLQYLSLDIGDILYSKSPQLIRPGVLTGDMGLGLLLESQLEYGNVGRLSEKIISLVEEMIFTCNKSPSLNLNYGSGLAGFGWLINFLTRRGLFSNPSDFLASLYPSVVLKLKRDLAYGNFDLFTGANGIMLFLTSYLQTEELDRHVKHYIDGLNHFANFDALGIRWPSFIRDRKSGELLKTYNYGIPHGLTGTMLLVLNLHHKYKLLCFPILTQMVDSLRHRIELVDKPVTDMDKTGSREDNAIRESVLGWCYGSLCMGYALLKAGKILGDESIKDLATSLIEKSESRAMKFNSIDDKLSLCHGYISIAYMYYKIYQLTGLYKNLYEKWTKISVDFLLSKVPSESPVLDINSNSRSLLYGLPGLLIPLNNILANSSGNWDNSILL